MKGRPPALSPAQQEDVRRRLAAGGPGNTVRALAAEFGVGKATIGRLAGHTGQVRKVAESLAAAHIALEALPVSQQHAAVSLAEKLRAISDNLAAAAMHGAATAHRLNALANSEVAKIDDAEPLQSLDALRGVGVLSKLANESASVALNLLSANRDRIPAERPAPAQLDPAKLSDGALQELLEARIPPPAQ